MKVTIHTEHEKGGMTIPLSNKDIVIILHALNELQGTMEDDDNLDLDGDNALQGAESLASFNEVNHMVTTFEELNDQFKYL